MADSRLNEWIRSLPGPALDRLVRNCVGSASDARESKESLVLAALEDETNLAAQLADVPPALSRLLAMMLDAGVPVRRPDAAAIAGPGRRDETEQLEERGLVSAVRTTAGMPSHLSVTPGLEAPLRRLLHGVQPPAPPSAAFQRGGLRRRFSLALLYGAVAAHPPRLTHSGEWHAADARALSAAFSVRGLEQRTLTRWALHLLERGAIGIGDGRMRPLYPAPDFAELFLDSALAELAAPSFPDRLWPMVRRLVSLGPQPLRALSEAVAAALLAERADTDPSERPGIRSEWFQSMAALMRLCGVVFADESGPVVSSDEALLERSNAVFAALDPGLCALLGGAPAPALPTGVGLVQSSFELFADEAVSPSLVAMLATATELKPGEHGARMQLTAASVRRALAMGLPSSELNAGLVRLAGGRPLPQNVTAALAVWERDVARAAPPAALTVPLEREELRRQIMNRLAAVDVAAVPGPA